jgi:hypothetical protein
VNRDRILERDSYTCLWCEERYSKGNLEVHHLVPRQLDGPNRDWNVATMCCHHHLLMTVAQKGCRWEAWWKAGEANLALGECFAYSLKARSKTETEMPQHVQDAITTAFQRMCSSLPDRFYEEDCDWDLADLHTVAGAPLMGAGAA